MAGGLTNPSCPDEEETDKERERERGDALTPEQSKAKRERKRGRERDREGGLTTPKKGVRLSGGGLCEGWYRVYRPE